MVAEKYGRANFRATDQDSGETWAINPGDYLTALQARMMATQPDMIRSFAEYIAADFRAHGHARVEIRGDVFASLNGRPHQRLVDPRVDLAHLGDATASTDWIFPLERRPEGRRSAGTALVNGIAPGADAAASVNLERRS